MAWELSMRYPMVPRLRETSTRRLELELLVEPTTRTRPGIVGHVAHGNLAVFGGVADVLRVGADDVGKLDLEGVNDVARLVERQRGLGEIGNAIGIGNLERSRPRPRLKRPG